MPATLVATVCYVPLKSKVFHSFTINLESSRPINVGPGTLNFYFPPLPHEDPQAEVLGLVSSSPAPQAEGAGLPSPAPHDEGFGSLSPVPQEEGIGFASPSFEPQEEPQPEEVILVVPEAGSFEQKYVKYIHHLLSIRLICSNCSFIIYLIIICNNTPAKWNKQTGMLHTQVVRNADYQQYINMFF